MRLATILVAFVTSARALSKPSLESKDSLQKGAEWDPFIYGLHDGGNQVSLEFAHFELSLPITRRDVIPQHYIVVLKKGQSESDYKAFDEWVHEQYTEMKKRGESPDNASARVSFFNVLNFMGYTGYFPPILLDDIRRTPIVDFVEDDQIFHSAAFAKQKAAPWGVARISHRDNTTSSDYDYDDQAGAGVTAFVLDTGIKVEHPDFEGRAKWGIELAPPYTKVDGDGHGTHVAGTIGGKMYGVAKKVELVAVQVMDAQGIGPASGIIKGIYFSVKQHQARVSASTNGYRGGIMNLSVGGPVSRAVDLAVNAAMDAGVHVVVAAGNYDQDACKFSPARATGPITVGATEMDDSRAYYANYGSCVKVQAPGTYIRSAGIYVKTAIMSGTSMAASHVTGVLSTFMSLQPDLGSEFLAGQLIKPADLKRKFLAFATKNVVTGLDKASPNLLAYNGAGLSLHDLWIL